MGRVPAKNQPYFGQRMVKLVVGGCLRIPVQLRGPVLAGRAHRS